MRAVTLLLGLLLAAAPAGAAERSVRYSARTMGTWGHVSLVTADSAAAFPTAALALGAFARVDSLMSGWTDTSELARLNREAPHRVVTVQPEVAEVLAAALAVGRASGGAFDITVEPLVRLWGFLGGRPAVPASTRIATLLPRIGLDWIRYDPGERLLSYGREDLRIDLGGVAKGYAADRARQALREAGIENALVDLAGNMAGLGAPAGRSSWVVGVRDPEDRRRWFARLRLGSDAVATSGDYEQFVAEDGRRYGHILDPRTGWPATGLRSVTVLAPTAMAADAWATALFVLGPGEATALLADRPELSAILVEIPSPEGTTVWISRSLRARFELVEESAGRFRLRWF